jgi:hypothetical protein
MEIPTVENVENTSFEVEARCRTFGYGGLIDKPVIIFAPPQECH